MHSPTEDLFSQKISSADFRRIRSLIYQHTAIVVPEEKQDFIRSRILKRMRHIKVSTLGEYCNLVETGQEALSDFTSQVTTNHTSGEEPYSIALTLREKIPSACNGSLRIIASDLDEKVLEKAQAGVYEAKRIEALSKTQKALGFMRGKNEMHGTVKTKEWMRSMIEFRKINLMEAQDFSRNVDVIFCRNVVIYFDHISKVKLFSNFADIQKSGDLLFIGHSESLNGISEAYQCLGSTVYRRL